MKVLLLPEAQREFLDAVEYYATADESLGRRFRNEVARCVGYIAQNHHHVRMRSGAYRRINLKVFPYYLPFVVRSDVLWVLAVAHAARLPEYWIDRKPEA